MEYTERLRCLIAVKAILSHLFQVFGIEIGEPCGSRLPRCCYLYPSRISVDVGHGLSLGLGRALLATTRLLARCLLWRVLGRVGSTR